MMTSSRDTPRQMPPWVDPLWSAITPEARQEQLRRLACARARGSALFLVMQGMDVEQAFAEEACREAKWAAAERRVAADEQNPAAAEEEAVDAWVRVVPAERAGDKRRSDLMLVGAVIFVLGVLCGVVLAVLRLR